MNELFGELSSSSDDDVARKIPPASQPPKSIPEKQTPKTTPGKQTAPRIGTTIQRSDAVNRRKIKILATPPPLKPEVRHRHSTPAKPTCLRPRAARPVSAPPSEALTRCCSSVSTGQQTRQTDTRTPDPTPLCALAKSLGTPGVIPASHGPTQARPLQVQVAPNVTFDRATPRGPHRSPFPHLDTRGQVDPPLRSKWAIPVQLPTTPGQHQPYRYRP